MLDDLVRKRLQAQVKAMAAGGTTRALDEDLARKAEQAVLDQPLAGLTLGALFEMLTGEFVRLHEQIGHLKREIILLKNFERARRSRDLARAAEAGDDD